MAIQIQLRQGTTTEHNTFTGAVGEVTVDTTKDVPVVHDGSTVGGHPVASRANADGTISLLKKDGTSAGTINATGLFNNTLTSTNTDQALTAAQGKELKDSLNATVSSSFGVGQTWVAVTSSRVVGTTYTNTTGRPITVNITLNGRNDSSSMAAEVGEVTVGVLSCSSAYGQTKTMRFIVPHGHNYRVTGTFDSWSELR